MTAGPRGPTEGAPLDLRAVEAELAAVVWQWGAANHKAGQESVRHSGYEARAEELLTASRLKLDAAFEKWEQVFAHCRALRAALIYAQAIIRRDSAPHLDVFDVVLGAAQDGEREP